MSQQLGQDQIINLFNDYAKKNNLPLHMNEGGVCHGLSMMYIKYCLEGWEDLFIQALSEMVEQLKRAEVDLDLNFFAAQVLMAFSPSQYDTSLTQTSKQNLLMVNGKPLIAQLNFSYAGTDSQWASVLRDIDLQSGEVMRVMSNSHTIAITRFDGGYKIYDPNYPTAFKMVDDELGLMKELHGRCLPYTTENIGLQINLFGKSAVPRPSLPSALTLYKAHLRADTLSAVCVDAFNETPFDMLLNEVESGNAETFEFLFSKKFTQEMKLVSNMAPSKKKDFLEKFAMQVERYLRKAIDNSNYDVIKVLSKFAIDNDMLSDEKIRGLIHYAIAHGKGTSFEEQLNAWLDNEHVPLLMPECFLKQYQLMKIHQPKSLLLNAIQGDNIELFDDQLNLMLDVTLGENNDIHPNVVKSLTLSNISKETCATELVLDFNKRDINLAQEIICHGSLDMLKAYIEVLTKQGLQVTEADYFKMTLLAIAENKEHMAAYCINKLNRLNQQQNEVKPFSPLVKDLTFKLNEVEKMDLNIIKLLQRNGVTFNEQQQYAISHKESQCFNLLKYIGNVITSVGEYFKSWFSRKDSFLSSANAFFKAESRMQIMSGGNSLDSASTIPEQPVDDDISQLNSLKKP